MMSNFCWSNLQGGASRIAGTKNATLNKRFTIELKAIQCIGLLGLGWLAIAEPAMAHHAMGKQLPVNGWQGFLSGLAHPIIGLDHLAFVVSIGLLSAQYLRGALIPAFFLVAGLGGTGCHLAKLSVPGTEILIALSVVLVGIVLALRKQLNFTIVAALATIAGLFHGYAYGEAIVGAEPTPLIAYLVGFTLVQYLIAIAAHGLAKVGAKATAEGFSLVRYVGYAVCAIGVLFVSVALT